MTAKSAASPLADLEQRGSERFNCAVPTTCQPPSAWGKDPWPCTICDISTGGLSLTLNRRFERGYGLAIQLPAEDGSSHTILAKVAHVRQHEEGGWFLGCDFISDLSDEEVQEVLNLDPVNNAHINTDEPATDATPAIKSVFFQARLETGETLRWFVKHLDLSANWPLTRGKVISLSVGGIPGNPPPLQMAVKNCIPYGSYWIVDGKLLQRPCDALLRALNTPK
jgi:hypothetical protein